MVRPRRFELLTYSFGGCRSIQLSYGRLLRIVARSHPQLTPPPHKPQHQSGPETHQKIESEILMFLHSLSNIACCALIAISTLAASAQEPARPMAEMNMPAQSGKLPSPPAKTSVTLAGKSITVDYSAPSMRGRTIMGGLVPYGEVWRTGANPATTLVTPVDLKIGTLTVPAGTYTLFTLPTAGEWTFIVSKKTGEWGIPYPEGNDLGRTPMMKKSLPGPQEVMSISFDHTMGAKTELHVKWETTDVYVPVSVAK